MGKDAGDIDLTKVHFPTDRFTVKDLRRLFPGDLDNRDLSPLYDLGEDSAVGKLAALLSEERLMAINVYEQARGINREFALRGDDLKQSIDELGGEYARFGLASGPAHGRELARNVERQALQQAARHGGKGR